MAHPDDVDFSAAGTVATWTDKGIEVTYLIVTAGDAGGFDPAVPRSEIAGIRRAEQTAAAKCVGVRAVGGAALDAVYPDARNPFTFPELVRDEGLEAWTAREVWISGGPAPNHHVDVTDVFDRKVAALKAHASQTAHMDGLENMLRGWLTAGAQSAGLPEGRLAEPFQVIPTP